MKNAPTSRSPPTRSRNCLRRVRGWITALRKLLALLVLLGLPSAAVGQLPVVSEAKAISAVEDCALATGPKGVDTTILEQRGWNLASIGGDDGEIATPLRIYGKTSGSPLLVTTVAAGQSTRGCIITGSLENRRSFGKLKEAFEAMFQTAGAKDGNFYFRIGRDIIALSATGSRRQPSFRVTVVEPSN